MKAFLLSMFLLPAMMYASGLPRFNPVTVRNFSGEVSSLQTFRYATRPTSHMQILLRTTNGEITVDLGPLWYLRSQGINIVPGDIVEIEGSLLKFNGIRFVIASSITIKNITYPLRPTSS